MEAIPKKLVRKFEGVLSYINIVTLHEVCERSQTVGAEVFCAKPRCNCARAELPGPLKRICICSEKQELHY